MPVEFLEPRALYPIALSERKVCWPGLVTAVRCVRYQFGLVSVSISVSVSMQISFSFSRAAALLKNSNEIIVD